MGKEVSDGGSLWQEVLEHREAEVRDFVLKERSALREEKARCALDCASTLEQHRQESEGARLKISQALQNSLAGLFKEDCCDKRSYTIVLLFCSLCHVRLSARRWSWLAWPLGFVLLYFLESRRKCRPVEHLVQGAMDRSRKAFLSLWKQCDIGELRNELQRVGAELEEAHRVQEEALRAASYVDLLCRATRAEAALEAQQRHSKVLQRQMEGIRRDVNTMMSSQALLRKSVETAEEKLTKAVKETHSCVRTSSEAVAQGLKQVAERPAIVNNYDQRSLRQEEWCYQDNRSFHQDNRSLAHSEAQSSIVVCDDKR